SAFEEAEKLTEMLKYEQAAAARLDIANRALEATLGGRKAAEWARDLLEIAISGLVRIAHLNEKGSDESVYLRRLMDIVRLGHCPADEILQRVANPLELLSCTMDQERS